MPKRKANWWPASILADPDVLSVDDEGRFVLCKICHVHYAVHGGKKPKPVIMNSNFRTRAWDVHKERTNSHRMQKQQEAEQQQRQQAAPPKEPPKSSTDGDAAPKDGAESQAAASKPPESGAGKRKATGKRPAMGAGGAPSPRRRAFRTGATTAETARRPAAGHARHSFLSPAVERKTAAGNEGGGGGGGAASTKQAEGLMRWRHMHDDVSRALSAAPKKRQTGTYTSGEMRAAKTLAQTETGGFGGNNSDKVAKKLRSLNDEYHAKAMRPADALYDRPSASYTEYWGTLRDVYSSGTGTASSSHKKSRASSKHPREENKETAEVDLTTPDESGGSSEDVFKPAVIVHDAALVHAVDRLTEATSQQLVGLYTKEASGTREALAELTSIMTDLRVQHGNAFGRMIELQEKHLKVMEGLLQLKLRKEAARNASNVASEEKNANEAARDARE
ncbi:hypothetical protein BBJ28_00012552 [Nothophytophthora sp. Chile5]|nr:hypothetical protein BBJ28_00012552 [Nothophytophthora sp. Chile5]